MNKEGWDVSKMSEHELLQKNNLKKLIQLTNCEHNDLYFEYRNRAKTLKITKNFDSHYRKTVFEEALSKMSTDNRCNFNDDRFDNICTGSWIANCNGIFKQVPNRETGEVTLIEASRCKIVPVETYVNIDTGEEKVKLMFERNGKWKEIIVNRETLSSAHKIVQLSRIGLDVTTSNCKNLVDYIYDVLTKNTPETLPHLKSLARLGWYKKSFIPYEKSITFDGEEENQHTYSCFKTRGSYEKWAKYTSMLRKNKFVKIQFAASFGSPLLHLLDISPFFVHFWGGSGSGKTVGMIAAMSVWGNPVLGGLTKTLNMTANSLMATCSFLNHLPFAGDELQMIKNKFENYDTLVMKVTEGVERGRMSYDKNNATRTWKNIFLTTGEDPIVKSNSGAGVKNRVLQVDCSDLKVVENGNEAVSVISQHYGHAGEIFIKSIDPVVAKKEFSDIVSEILEKFHASTEKQAICAAVLVLADRLACACIYPDENPLTIDDFEEFLQKKDDVSIYHTAYEEVVNIISANANNFSPEARECWGKLGDGYVFINKSILADQMNKRNLDFDAVKKVWHKLGYLEKSTDNKFRHRLCINGIKGNYIKIKIEYTEEETSPFL